MKVKYSSHIIILLLSFMVGGGTDLFGCLLVPCVCCSPTILFVPYYLIICFSVCVECTVRLRVHVLFIGEISLYIFVIKNRRLCCNYLIRL